MFLIDPVTVMVTSRSDVGITVCFGRYTWNFSTHRQIWKNDVLGFLSNPLENRAGIRILGFCSQWRCRLRGLGQSATIGIPRRFVASRLSSLGVGGPFARARLCGAGSQAASLETFWSLLWHKERFETLAVSAVPVGARSAIRERCAKISLQSKATHFFKLLLRSPSDVRSKMTALQCKSKLLQLGDSLPLAAEAHQATSFARRRRRLRWRRRHGNTSEKMCACRRTTCGHRCPWGQRRRHTARRYCA